MECKFGLMFIIWAIRVICAELDFKIREVNSLRLLHILYIVFFFRSKLDVISHDGVVFWGLSSKVKAKILEKLNKAHGLFDKWSPDLIGIIGDYIYMTPPKDVKSLGSVHKVRIIFFYQ